MRALMISDVAFPRVNGVSTSIQTFRRDLAALGAETWLNAPRYPEPWQNDDAHVRRVPSRYVVFDPEDRMMSYRATLNACLELRGSIDLVHVQTPFVAHYVGLRAARVLDVPTVETYHTFFEEYLHHYLPLLPAGIARTFARAVSRRQSNGADAIVAPSSQLADVLDRYGVSKPIHTIPTGVDLDEFAVGDGASFRARHGIAATRPVMLVVSRIAHEKNLEFLLRAAALVRRRVPDVLFLIAGEGPALPTLHRTVAALDLAEHTRFVGYLDRRRELLDCYRAADVFVFASRTETQGLVLLESLALGVPVVSTAVLGTRAVLAGARGAIVVEEEVTAFAAAVGDVLTQPELRARLARNGPDFVAQRWSSREMARRLLALYEELVRTRRAASMTGLQGAWWRRSSARWNARR
jgi:1,2-diacylglycerol 3-alpha-glucosyltransferase